MIGFYQKAFELNQAVLSKNITEKNNATAIFNKGAILNQYGQVNQAFALYEQSLAINRKIGDRKGEGATLNNLGTAAHAKGDYDTALRFLEQSLAIRQQISDISGLATTLTNMGAIYWEQKNDVENAVKAFVKSYQILKKIGSPNIQYPANYLNTIIETIGQTRFEQILAQLNAS